MSHIESLARLVFDYFEIKIKSILLSAFTTFIFASGWAQNQIIMTTKKIKIREDKVEINYYQQGKGELTLLFLHKSVL